MPILPLRHFLLLVAEAAQTEKTTNCDSTALMFGSGRTIAKFGRIDVLVNNAGYGTIGAIEEVTDAEVRQQYETNVFGALDVMRAVLPHMRDRRQGHILSLSSVGGVVSFPGAGIYDL